MHLASGFKQQVSARVPRHSALVNDTRKTFGPVGEGPPADGGPHTSALLVVGADLLKSGDAVLQSRLSQAGLVVTVTLAKNARPSGATGIVVISSSAKYTDVDSGFRTFPGPVAVAKPWAYPALGLANVRGASGTNTMSVTQIQHSLVNGLAPNPELVSGYPPMAYGYPDSSADVVATVKGKPSLVSYQPGDALVGGGTAPSCRIMMPLMEPALAKLTDSGRRLADNVIESLRTC